MPQRKTRADLLEATCGGNRRAGALTFHETATQISFTHKHVNVSNALFLSLSFSHTHTNVEKPHTLATYVLFVVFSHDVFLPF